MRSRAVRLTLSAMAVGVLAAAAFFVFQTEQQIEHQRAAAKRFEERIRAVDRALADLRMGLAGLRRRGPERGYLDSEGRQHVRRSRPRRGRPPRRGRDRRRARVVDGGRREHHRPRPGRSADRRLSEERAGRDGRRRRVFRGRPDGSRRPPTRWTRPGRSRGKASTWRNGSAAAVSSTPLAQRPLSERSRCSCSAQRRPAIPESRSRQRKSRRWPRLTTNCRSRCGASRATRRQS